MMAMKALPTNERLHKVLRCDLSAGKLYWRHRTPDQFAPGKRTAEHQCNAWNSKNAGREAFTATVRGYRQGAIDGVTFFAHRIIWKMACGADPDQIDHINRNTIDNRISNLRSVSDGENKKNMGIYRSNTSGFPGVHKVMPGRWRAQIQVGERRYYSAVTDSPEEAFAHRRKMLEEHGFHPNHGLDL